MTESDVRVHLSRQTAVSVGLVDLVAMKSGQAEATRDTELGRGARVIALDVVDDETLEAAGSLIWAQAGESCLAIGSQGVEYALVAHWRAAGLLAPAGQPSVTPRAERIAVVSGSCSPLTAEQIAWAEGRGFEVVPVDAARAVDAAAWTAETRRAAEAALGVLSRGRDPILCTARGPDGPETSRYREAVAASGADALLTNQRVGEGLGRSLAHVLREAKLRRAAIAGGDTSSHGTSALGIYALTALAPTTPGAALCAAHSDDPALAGLELALKGGQMGTPDYFGRIKQGGGLNASEGN